VEKAFFLDLSWSGSPDKVLGPLFPLPANFLGGVHSLAPLGLCSAPPPLACGGLSANPLPGSFRLVVSLLFRGPGVVPRFDSLGVDVGPGPGILTGFFFVLMTRRGLARPFIFLPSPPPPVGRSGWVWPWVRRPPFRVLSESKVFLGPGAVRLLLALRV